MVPGLREEPDSEASTCQETEEEIPGSSELRESEDQSHEEDQQTKSEKADSQSSVPRKCHEQCPRGPERIPHQLPNQWLTFTTKVFSGRVPKRAP